MSSTIKNVVNDAVTGVKHGMHSQSSYTTHSAHSAPSHGYSTTQYSSSPHHTSYSTGHASGHVSGHSAYTTGHSAHQTGGHSAQYTSGHSAHHTGGHSAHHTGGHSAHHTGGHSVAVVGHSSHQTTRKVSEVVKGDQLVLPANAYEQSRRQVSSVIVYEEEDKIPERNVRYVEVPQYEEVIKHVPIKEIREVEKFVPKIVEEWVERIVEIPQIEEVVRHVEVPQIQEVIKHVPKVEIVDRPYEVIKNVPKIEIQKVEKVVDHSETIEVPKAVLVEERVNIASTENRDAMLIVSQKVKPVIVDGGKEVLVDVVEYEPEVMPVDIHVAKFVEQELVMVGAKETIHRVVTVPAAQYNSMLRFLNIHLTEEEIQNLPYLKDVSGQISFLPQDYEWHAPQEGLKIYGYRQGTIYGHGTPVVVHSRSGSHMNEAEVRAKQAELDRQFQQIFQQFESERVRRVNAVEEFNRQQEQKVRNALAHNSSHNSSYGHAAISHSSHSTHYPTTAYGHSTSMHSAYMPSASRHSAGSIAYQTGHAVGSAISHRK